MNCEISQKEEQFKDNAFGCVIGALCGDSIGVPVEFQRDVSVEVAKRCLEQNGGGPFRLGGGQVTDDGELALCLAAGLVADGCTFNLHKIACMYHKWFLSRPFDIGITTRTAFKGAETVVDEKHATTMREYSSKSINSLSNGGLMRIHPLCVFTSKLRLDDLMTAVRAETRLTHPNPTAQNVSIAYVYTVNHLLNHPGENKQAYRKCKTIIYDILKDPILIEWMDEFRAGVLPHGTPQQGFVKIAFLYSLYFLKKNTPYEEAMIEMLTKGGDTDTNCCIVGGMLGALHGLKGIPLKFREKVLGFRATENKGKERPDFLVPRLVVEPLIEKIIEIRPETLDMKGGEKEGEN